MAGESTLGPLQDSPVGGCWRRASGRGHAPIRNAQARPRADLMTGIWNPAQRVIVRRAGGPVPSPAALSEALLCSYLSRAVSGCPDTAVGISHWLSLCSPTE